MIEQARVPKLKHSIPSFKFPTTIMMIDDNIEFLKSIAIGLPAEKATYNFFSDPGMALKLINENYCSDKVADGLVNLIDEEELEHKTLDINVRDIYRIMYNKMRFQQISTVVVDYHMPGMDGIEFCKSIENPNIQKILLTSIVDESKAIEVLNEGLINTFIRKQSPNVMQLLSQAIAQAQHRYFLNLSQIIQQVVSFSPSDSAISDPAFVEYFNGILNKYNISEYYQTEFLGSFVLLDAIGNHYGFFTRIDEQIEHYCDSKESESAPKDVLENLRARKQILCHHNDKSLALPDGRVWEQYLFDAVKVKGKNNYYCAHGPNMFDIRNSDLISFNQYSSPAGMDVN